VSGIERGRPMACLGSSSFEKRANPAVTIRRAGDFTMVRDFSSIAKLLQLYSCSRTTLSEIKSSGTTAWSCRQLVRAAPTLPAFLPSFVSSSMTLLFDKAKVPNHRWPKKTSSAHHTARAMRPHRLTCCQCYQKSHLRARRCRN
jgi:hypothetical protein